MSKTSFILHLDMLSVLDELDDKQAGKLFKTIKEYQMRVAERCEQDADTGFDFVVEDFVTRIAFAPFKAQFIRDNERYEEKATTRSEAGRLGNLKRWHQDLHQEVANGKISLQEAETIANNRKTSHSDNSIANIAIKDKDNDNKKEKDNDNKKEKVKKENSPIGDTHKSFKSFSLQDFAEELKPYVEEYGQPMIRQFYDYWTEPNGRNKPKFQLEKTWDTARRLRTWKQNEEKFGVKTQTGNKRSVF